MYYKEVVPSVASYSRQVVQSFLWQGTAQVLGQAVSWLATIAVVRLLLPADYGLMAMANVFLGFFFLFADWGFGLAAVQANVLDVDQQRRMLGVVVVTNLAGWSLTVATAPLVSAFFDEPRLTAVIRVLAFNFLLLSAYVLPQASLLREMAFRTKARIDVLAMILAALTSLALASAGRGVWALVASAVVIHAVKAVAYNVAVPQRLALSFSWGPITRLAQFGALVTLDRLLFFLYGQADTIIGGRVLGKDALGLYAVALSLAVVPMEKILPVITQVSFAAFSRIQADTARVQRNFLRAVQLVSLVCFPAFLGLAAIASDIVPLVLGPKWSDLIVPFQLICLTLPLKAVAALFSPALLGLGQARTDVVNMATALVVMTIALVIGVGHGVIGICLAWLVAYPPVFAAIAWRSLKVLETRFAEFLKRCAFPALASAAMVAGVLGLRSVVVQFGSPLLRLAALVLGGVLIYCSLVVVFQRSALRDLLTASRA